MGGTSINNWSPTVVKYCEMLVEKKTLSVCVAVDTAAAKKRPTEIKLKYLPRQRMTSRIFSLVYQPYSTVRLP